MHLYYICSCVYGFFRSIRCSVDNRQISVIFSIPCILINHYPLPVQLLHRHRSIRSYSICIFYIPVIRQQYLFIYQHLITPNMNRSQCTLCQSTLILLRNIRSLVIHALHRNNPRRSRTSLCRCHMLLCIAIIFHSDSTGIILRTDRNFRNTVILNLYTLQIIFFCSGYFGIRKWFCDIIPPLHHLIFLAEISRCVIPFEMIYRTDLHWYIYYSGNFLYTDIIHEFLYFSTQIYTLSGRNSSCNIIPFFSGTQRTKSCLILRLH